MAKRCIIAKKKKEFRDPITAWFPRDVSMTFEERAQKFQTDDN